MSEIVALWSEGQRISYRLNEVQRPILAVAFGVAAALCLFPPAVATRVTVAEGRVSNLGREFSGGHHLILSLPKLEEHRREVIPGPSILDLVVYRVDYPRLIVMLAGVGLLTAAMITMLHPKSPKTQVQMVPAAMEGGVSDHVWTVAEIVALLD